MILTGKALEHYKIWFDKYYNDYWTYYQSKPTILNALIIEWFDSVGNLNNKRCVYNFKTLYLSTFKQLEKHHSILDIQKITIKKANEIYNDKK